MSAALIEEHPFHNLEHYYRHIYSPSHSIELFSNFTTEELNRLEIYGYFLDKANNEEIPNRILSLLGKYFLPNTELMFNGVSVADSFHFPIYWKYKDSIFIDIIKSLNIFRSIEDFDGTGKSRFLNVAEFILISYQKFSLYYYNKFVLPNENATNSNRNKEHIIGGYTYLINTILHYHDGLTGRNNRLLKYWQIQTIDALDDMGESIYAIIFEHTRYTEIVCRGFYESRYDNYMKVANFERDNGYIDEDDEEDENDEEDN